MSDHSHDYNIDIVCSVCRSTDVARDAWAHWNKDTQEWELGNVFDNAYCFTCDGETSLDEVRIDEQETPHNN